MASIRLKPNSKYYIACFTGKDGAQQQKSTKTTDKKLAQKIADAWEKPYREKCTVTTLRKTFSEIAEDVGSKLSLTTSVREYFNRWLEEIRGEPSPDTYTRYCQIVRDSLVRFGDASDRPMDEIDRGVLIEARLAIAKHSSTRNANTYLKVWKRIIRAAVDDDLLDSDPMRKIKFLDEEEPDRGVRRPFRDDELHLLYQVLTGEWPLLVHFAENTGQRLGDIVSCKRKDIDLKARIWFFYSQKTARAMRVPLTPSLHAALNLLPAGHPDTPIFPVAFAQKKKDGGSRRLSAAFYQFMIMADLASKRGKKNTGHGHSRRRRTNELSFHCFRHNANSNLLMAGVPETIVHDIIGHDSKLVALGYTHIDDATKVAAVAKIDARSNVNLEAGQ